MRLIRKYAGSLIMLGIFETVAVALWLSMDNLFYLFNFSYIGLSLALGLALYTRKYRHARRVVQLLVGLYMLLYLGLMCRENMQIEGFWYYLFLGVFEAATIHYAVPDPECDLDVVPNTGREQSIRYALSNSLGFGGHNGSILLKKWEA